MAVLETILEGARVRCGVDCASKKRALEIIAGLIAAGDESALCEKLNERERLGSTGIGEGIAIPHCRLSACRSTRAALITLRSPIDFSAIDDRPVDVLFALVVPDDAPEEHLALLGRLAELFNNAGVRARLRGCRGNEELHQAMIAAWNAV